MVFDERRSALRWAADCWYTLIRSCGVDRYSKILSLCCCMCS